MSSRQQEILRLLVDGRDNRTIAQQLELSVKTIENHLTRLYRQLSVQSRLEAANFVRDHPELIAHTGQSAVETKTAVDMPVTEQGAILLVDDNQRYRGQLRRMLAKVCPQAMIYEAGNTTEALQLAKRVNPWITFVDVVLADEDGIYCTRRMKAQMPSSRIILISAYPDREF
ncbi:MAG: LuxR C-terminal-related transcriptional regulator, partial [Anaerolineae bacterium]